MFCKARPLVRFRRDPAVGDSAASLRDRAARRHPDGDEADRPRTHRDSTHAASGYPMDGRLARGAGRLRVRHRALLARLVVVDGELDVDRVRIVRPSSRRTASLNERPSNEDEARDVA